MTRDVEIRRALISVSDKAGVVELARALQDRGIEIISTGGTLRALEEHGVTVQPVEAVTGFPEMMGGRVKTLHPAVHGGVLAVRDDESHSTALQTHGIGAIDLVCVNLYPFEQTITSGAATLPEAIEQIDIGGPALVRSAAKNHEWVTVLTDPAQYEQFLDELNSLNGSSSLALRRELAGAAFARTSAYDASISGYLSHQDGEPHDVMPATLAITMQRERTLRYGENPHQAGALYRDPFFKGTSIVGAQQLHGKELSYNNINDAAAALSLVEDLARAREWDFAASVIKHANPCGAAVARTAHDAVRAALAGDPIAAYGGILAIGAVVGEQAAEVMCSADVFLEVIIAEGFEQAALDRLRTKSKNVRLLTVGEIGRIGQHRGFEVRTLAGGALAQTVDDAPVDISKWEHRAGPRPSEERLRDAGVVWAIAKQMTSNAVAIGAREHDGKAVRLFGAGAGQVDRLTACKLAVEKSARPGKRAIAASDAFFPFPDGPELLIQAGVTLIVHPGGSKRDQETFDLCARMGVTCMTTGIRHFRH